MEKVHAGQRFRPQADAWNAFIDAAMANQDRRLAGGAIPGEGELLPGVDITIKNISDRDVPMGGALQLVEPLFTADDGAEAFRDLVALTADEPEAQWLGGSGGPMVIPQEPIAAGGIGRARILGMSVVKLSVGTGYGDRRFAIPNGPIYWTVSDYGPARVMWHQGEGAAVQYAMVELCNTRPDLVFYDNTTGEAVPSGGLLEVTGYDRGDAKYAIRKPVGAGVDNLLVAAHAAAIDATRCAAFRGGHIPYFRVADFSVSGPDQLRGRHYSGAASGGFVAVSDPAGPLVAFEGRSDALSCVGFMLPPPNATLFDNTTGRALYRGELLYRETDGSVDWPAHCGGASMLIVAQDYSIGAEDCRGYLPGDGAPHWVKIASGTTGDRLYASPAGAVRGRYGPLRIVQVSGSYALAVADSDGIGATLCVRRDAALGTSVARLAHVVRWDLGSSGLQMTESPAGVWTIKTAAGAPDATKAGALPGQLAEVSGALVAMGHLTPQDAIGVTAEDGYLYLTSNDDPGYDWAMTDLGGGVVELSVNAEVPTETASDTGAPTETASDTGAPTETASDTGEATASATDSATSSDVCLTTISDNFNRSEDPLAADWNVEGAWGAANAGNIYADGTVARMDAGSTDRDAWAWYDTPICADNQEITATQHYSGLDGLAQGYYLGLAGRANAAESPTAYYFTFYSAYNTNQGRGRIYKRVGGTNTQIGDTGAASGYFGASSHMLRIYSNTVAYTTNKFTISWVTDNDISDGHYTGFYMRIREANTTGYTYTDDFSVQEESGP